MSRKKKVTQIRLIQYQDLALFSGTAPKIPNEIFDSNQVVIQQERMFDCPVCQDTGLVRVDWDGETIRCMCGKGGSS